MASPGSIEKGLLEQDDHIGRQLIAWGNVEPQLTLHVDGEEIRLWSAAVNRGSESGKRLH
ncbi:MAG: hypothetical protein LAP86_20880 [Acidobacteriia bacterium]|nr:hypothetical protein [Terriglobia bacterium]